MGDTVLYLAYGSNLNISGMKSRCPDAEPLASFMLDNAKLVFRGVADVEYCAGRQVPIGVWEVSKADEKMLDAYEGIKAGLYYKEYLTLRWRGKTHKALIYLMLSDGVYPPSQYYVDTIRKGYANFGFNQDYLDRAIKESFLKKEPDEQTIDRRRRQRESKHQYHLVKMPEAIIARRRQQILSKIS